jgi:hypothetical protein
MRKLTKDEVERLRGLESEKFMKELENIYKDDEEALTEIQKCKSMKESLQWIETYPAYAKSYEMFTEYLRGLLDKIGYYDETTVNI